MNKKRKKFFILLIVLLLIGIILFLKEYQIEPLNTMQEENVKQRISDVQRSFTINQKW